MSRQKLGQHFLNNPAWQNRILEKLPYASNDIWIEIGAGQGQLTRHLSRHARRLVAIETDPLLAQSLRAQIAANPYEWPNIEIAEGDVLSLDVLALARRAGLAENEKFRVYGNLPYYITSPIVHRLFQWVDHIASIHTVIQLEVAQRIAAKPRSRDYGYLSVACQLYTHPEIAFKIPPGAFRPPPKVDSALVSMSLPGERTNVSVSDDALFLRFVQACFAHKRKILRNNLRPLASDEVIHHALAESGLTQDARAEELSLAQFASLSAHLRQKGDS